MKMFQVVPNPYRTLDADGKPTGVFPCHHKHAPGEYVGATKTLTVTEKATFVTVKGRRGVRQEIASYDRSKAVFTFAFDPVQVPGDGEVGHYYRRGVQSGALLPADKATADACCVKFVPVKEALDVERQRAAKEFQRQSGSLPAWASESQSQPAPIAAPN